METWLTCQNLVDYYNKLYLSQFIISSIISLSWGGEKDGRGIQEVAIVLYKYQSFGLESERYEA